MGEVVDLALYRRQKEEEMQAYVAADETMGHIQDIEMGNLLVSVVESMKVFERCSVRAQREDVLTFLTELYRVLQVLEEYAKLPDLSPAFLAEIRSVHKQTEEKIRWIKERWGLSV